MMKLVKVRVVSVSVVRNLHGKSVFEPLGFEDTKGHAVCVKTVFDREATYHMDLYFSPRMFSEKFTGYGPMSTVTIVVPVDLGSAKDYKSSKGYESKILPAVNKDAPVLERLSPVVAQPELDCDDDMDPKELEKFLTPFGKVTPIEEEEDSDDLGLGEE